MEICFWNFIASLTVPKFLEFLTQIIFILFIVIVKWVIVNFITLGVSIFVELITKLTINLETSVLRPIVIATVIIVNVIGVLVIATV